MLYYTILYYTTLYYTILSYPIPYYTIIYYTILHYTILYHIVQYYTILCYVILLLSSISHPRADKYLLAFHGWRRLPIRNQARQSSQNVLTPTCLPTSHPPSQAKACAAGQLGSSQHSRQLLRPPLHAATGSCTCLYYAAILYYTILYYTILHYTN